METEDLALKARANALYWESDDSVNDIADRLDLSKGALYGLVDALPANEACPECGGGLEYPNRTAREKGFVSCPECGLEEELALIRAAADEDAMAHLPVGTPVDGVPTRTAVAAGLIGLAAGILIGQWARSR
jgi:hypothetical protein